MLTPRSVAQQFEELSRNPNLQHFAQHTAVAIASPTTLVSGGKIWGQAGDGMVQGSAGAGTGFTVAIQPDPEVLNTDLEALGGLAKAGQDDVFALGPSPDIFNCIEKFSQNLWARCGLQLQRTKTVIYSPHGLPPYIPSGMKPAGNWLDGRFEPGVDVYGCPVGSRQWVDWWLAEKLEIFQRQSLQNSRT